jgi:hypothetical protein
MVQNHHDTMASSINPYTLPSKWKSGGQKNKRMDKNHTKDGVKWMGASNLGSSVIHLPNREHKLGIPDLEEINDERKFSIFTQFIHSNDEKLRLSTINNIRLEYKKRNTIMYQYNVLESKRKGKKDPDKFTLIYIIEKLLRKYGLMLMISGDSECWCTLLKVEGEVMWQCRECRKIRHGECDPAIEFGQKCTTCRLGRPF